MQRFQLVGSVPIDRSLQLVVVFFYDVLHGHALGNRVMMAGLHLTVAQLLLILVCLELFLSAHSVYLLGLSFLRLVTQHSFFRFVLLIVVYVLNVFIVVGEF